MSNFQNQQNESLKKPGWGLALFTHDQTRNSERKIIVSTPSYRRTWYPELHKQNSAIHSHWNTKTYLPKEEEITRFNQDSHREAKHRSPKPSWLCQTWNQTSPKWKIIYKQSWMTAPKLITWRKNWQNWKLVFWNLGSSTLRRTTTPWDKRTQHQRINSNLWNANKKILEKKFTTSHGNELGEMVR